MSTPGYRVIHWSQHWSIIDGAYYRDAIAIRLADGARRLISVLDES